MFDVIMYDPSPPNSHSHKLTPISQNSMILPFPVLMTTQIPLKKKLILLGLFSLGTFITIIQIIRIQFIRIQTIHSLANYLDSGLIMWSMVESDLGIIICYVISLLRGW